MPFSIKTSVSSHDIDTNLNATPSAVVRYLLEAVDSNMRECGPSYQELFDKGMSFIVSRTAVELSRPLREYEALTVSTWATPSKSATFPRSYTIEADGETVAKCVMTWALVDINEGKLLRGDALDVGGYGTGDVLELDIPSRLRIPKEINFNYADSVKVAFRDIDRNFHMNNTRYFDILFGLIPDFNKYYMSSCLVNYISEARLDDIIKIYVSDIYFEDDGKPSVYFRTEVNDKTNVEAKFTLGEI